MIKPIDKERDTLVRAIIERAKPLQQAQHDSFADTHYCEESGRNVLRMGWTQRLAEQVEQHLVALEEQIREWADGMGDPKDE